MDILQNGWSAWVEGEMALDEAGEGGRSRLILRELRAMGTFLSFRQGVIYGTTGC